MVIKLEFDAIPSMAGVYTRALSSRKPALFDGVIPRIEAHLSEFSFGADTLTKYRDLCGFAQTQTVPWTYPQVIAAPLHGQIMAHPKFPIPLLGLVHVRQSITVHRPIEAGEKLSVRTFIEGHHEAKRGVEFDLFTEFSTAEELVWQGQTTVLHLRKGGPKSKKNRAVIHGDEPGSFTSSFVNVPEDMGRRYSTVGRDFNPIHLYPMTAKMFGFKRAIAHGMWTLARTLAELEDELGSAGHVSASFVRPVYLPSRMVISANRVSKGVAFQVRSPDSKTTHLLGHIHKI